MEAMRDPSIPEDVLRVLIEHCFVRGYNQGMYPFTAGESRMSATVRKSEDGKKIFEMTERDSAGRLMGCAIVAFEGDKDGDLVVNPGFEGLDMNVFESIATDRTPDPQ